MNPLAAAVVLALSLAASSAAAAGPGYPSTADLADRLAALAQAHPGMVRLETVGLGLPLVTVSRLPLADQPQQPALLVVAGVDANDLAGPVCVTTAAEALVAAARTNDAFRRVLDHASILLLPRVAAGDPGWHQRPRVERTVSATPPVDEDHDGLADEDGPDDLDGDGWITSMRVEDPGGEFILDPDDERLLLKSDRARGESGAWRLLSEGRDNDGDEAWNEDGPGGVHLNRNFPANYRFFDPGAGTHPVSDPIARTLADFLLARPQIALVFTLGTSLDNLSQTPKGESGGKRPATTLHETDVPWYAELGRVWRQSLGVDKEFPGATLPGAFPDWVYLHRGRLSIAARTWCPSLASALAPPPETKAPKASAAPADGGAPGAVPTNAPPAKAGKRSEDRNEEERAYLRWVEAHAPEAFMAWRRYEHPEFPGRRVELGGWRPWARSNPPEGFLADVARRQSGFILDLAQRLPRVGLRRAEVKARGHGVFDIRIEVENTGWLPTVLAHGEVTGEVLPSRATLSLEEGTFLSGARTQRLGTLPGSGGMEEVRWVILAPGQRRVEVEVISTLGGRLRTTLHLPEEPR